jgi:hypothetical protein
MGDGIMCRGRSLAVDHERSTRRETTMKLDKLTKTAVKGSKQDESPKVAVVTSEGMKVKTGIKAGGAVYLDIDYGS